MIWAAWNQPTKAEIEAVATAFYERFDLNWNDCLATAEQSLRAAYSKVCLIVENQVGKVELLPARHAGTQAMSKTAREVIAQAVMIANGCGLTLENTRAFCDDARAEQDIRAEKCDCKGAAGSIIEALTVAGFVTVPVEPTAAMLDAAVADAGNPPTWGHHEAQECYRAMLAAASRETG